MHSGRLSKTTHTGRLSSAISQRKRARSHREAVKILAFRHFPSEHLGRIADSLGSGSEYVDLYLGQRAPEIRDAAGLIFLGGQMSANDDLPYIRAELDLIGQAVSLGKPLLGVCLGAQLIASLVARAREIQPVIVT